MVDIESPPVVKATRNSHQEKKLRKRRELDALIKDVGGGRKRRRVGVDEELLSKEDESSSDSGEGQIHEGVGVTVWRNSGTPRQYTVLWGLKWALTIGTIFLLGTITVWLHISTRFELDVVRRHIVRVDDDSRSVPDTLHIIQSKLQSLQGNQSEVLVNLSDLTKSVANLQSRLDMFNITKNKEGGEELIQQSVADLGVKVSEIKQMLEITTNNSNTNTVSISMITTELNNLKLNDIDLKNGAGTSHTSVNPTDVINIKVELAKLNESLVEQSQKVKNLNSTLLRASQNSTVMIDWVKQDVVALQGKVSQLQDDNQNVSSRLSSLSERCNSQFLTTLSNISSLQTFVSSVENKLENVNLLLKTTVLPIPSSPAFPPGLFSLSTAALPVKKTSNTPTIIQPVVTSQPDQLDMQNRMGPWDKRQDQSNDGLSVSRDQK